MLIDLFSKRRKRQTGEVPDVYQYETIPVEVRVQIAQIITDALEPKGRQDAFALDAYEFLHKSLAREYGMFALTDAGEGRHPNYRKALFDFFLNTDDTDRALDVVELAFRLITLVVPKWQSVESRIVSASDAVEELNIRFKESGVGYQFVSGEIIRLDSEILHAEAVLPALRLLTADHFRGANAEFLKAHEHYRHGRNKEAINEALKSLESTLKAICERHQWQVEPGATAKRLLDICFTNNLVPAHLQAHFAALRATLEAGVPTIRNKTSGHGQGSRLLEVPTYLVSYTLNLTASAIRFLAEADGGLTSPCGREHG